MSTMVLMFLFFFLLLMAGVPMAWTTSAIGIIFALILWGPDSLNLIVLRIWDVMGSFSLIGIPLFVFMGNVLAHSGTTDKLLKAIYVWMGPIRGGLAVATVIMCMILAAILGTVGADVTITGIVALPFMLKYKYDKHLALGTIAAGGALGVLIPPSILFIIYGVTVGESIGALFIGGMGAGIVLGGLYLAYILVRCYLQPELGPLVPKEEGKVPISQKLILLTGILPSMFLILAVLGSIFFGLATPGEADGLGAAGALVCAAVSRRLNWETLKLSLFGTMKTVGMIMWVVFGAMVFIATFNLSGSASLLTNFVLSLELNRWVILIFIQFILLCLGMVLDVAGIIVLCAPIFVPIIKSLGFDPIWFGVLFNVNLQLAYLSPPFGYSAFYLKAVAPKDCTLADIYRGSFPFMVLQIVAIALFMLFPDIILILPRLMAK